MAEFTIDARQAFATFDQIDRRLGELERNMSRAKDASRNVFTSGLDSARKEVATLDQVQREYKELNDIVTRFRANLKTAWDPRAIEAYTRGIIQAENEMRRLERGASAVGVNLKKSLSQDAKGLGDSLLGSLKGAALAAGAGISLGSAITEGLALNAEYERIRTSLTVILKDAGKADKLLGKLGQFAAETPFQSDQINQAATALLAFGVSEDEVINKLREIGTVSAATGKDFNELTTIYGKAQVAGVLYAEDINQLVEAGIPIISEFAKQMGVSEAQVKKLASEGKVSFSQLEQAFTNLTTGGGQFSGLLEAQGKTLGGLTSTLKDNFAVALRNAFSGVVPITKEIISAAIDLLDVTKDQSEALEDERIAFLATANQVRITNEGTEARTKLINTLKSEYPQFLGQIDAEKVTNEQLQPILDKINQSYIIRIALQKQQEKIQPLLEAQAERENTLAESRSKYNTLLIQGAEAAGVNLSLITDEVKQRDAVLAALRQQAKFQEGVGFSKPLNQQAEVLARIGSQLSQIDASTIRQVSASNKVKQAEQERQGVVNELKKAYGEIFDLAVAPPPAATGNKPTGTTGGATNDKQLKEDIKTLKEATDLLAKIRAALAPEGLEGELSAINQKYDDLVQAVEAGIMNLNAIEARRGLTPAQRAEREALDASLIDLESKRFDELNRVLVDANEKERAINEQQLKARAALAEKILQGDIKALSEQQKLTEQDIALEEEGGRRVILAMRAAGASEERIAEQQRQMDLRIQKLRLEAQLKFQEGLLNITGETNEQQAAEIKKTIDLIKSQIETIDIQVAEPTITAEPAGKQQGLLGLLGIKLNENDAQTVEDSAAKIIESIQAITAARVAAAEEEVAAAEERITTAESALDREIQLAELGFASNVTLRRKELEDAKKNQAAALAEKQKAAKAQLLVDSLTQASSIATSAVNLIQSWSSLPFGVGLIAAAAQIAGMIAFIVSTRAKARAISRARYGASGFLDSDGIVRGRYHSHGGENLEVEHGEMVQVGQDGSRRRVEVVRRERVAQYMDLLRAANSGDRLAIAQQALQLADVGSLPVSTQRRLFGRAAAPDIGVAFSVAPTLSRRKVERRVFGDGAQPVSVLVPAGSDNERTNQLLEKLIRITIQGQKSESWSPDGKTKRKGSTKIKYV